MRYDEELNDEAFVEHLKHLDRLGYEEPDGFCAESAAASFASRPSDLHRVVPAISEEICLDQDSTRFAMIRLPRDLFSLALADGDLPLGSFGKLLFVFRPGVELRSEVDKEVRTYASRHGYQILPERVAFLPYSGVHSGFSTWLERFFGYL